MTERNIYECIKETKMLKSQDKDGRYIILEKGEIVQFRYNSPKHFRTLDEEYFKVSDEIWKTNFKLVGLVWDKISWNNKATLKEIIKLNLFDRVEAK